MKSYGVFIVKFGFSAKFRIFWCLQIINSIDFNEKQYFLKNIVFLKSYGVFVELPCGAPKFRIRKNKVQLRSSSGSRVMSK